MNMVAQTIVCVCVWLGRSIIQKEIKTQNAKLSIWSRMENESAEREKEMDVVKILRRL